MSLRDQLLKSGLASKEQAKRAGREAKQRQHQKIQEKASGSEIQATDAERLLEEKRQADKQRSQQINEEKKLRENEARAIDILMSHDQSDAKGDQAYYFRLGEAAIGRVLVNDRQMEALAEGAMAIAAIDAGVKLFLLDAVHAEKVASCQPNFLLCWHKSES